MDTCDTGSAGREGGGEGGTIAGCKISVSITYDSDSIRQQVSAPSVGDGNSDIINSRCIESVHLYSALLVANHIDH